MTRRILIIIFFFGQYILLGQTGIFNSYFQSNTDLIDFNSRSGKKYSFYQYVRTADSVILKKATTSDPDHFIDSLKKNGYSDKEPINLAKGTTWTSKVISHEFLRFDTIYSKPDSIFITILSVTLINPKHKLNRTRTLKVYSNLNANRLAEKMKFCGNHGLVYFSKSNIYCSSIDLSIFTWLIGRFEVFQTGQYFETEYF
jgi:hypothetical protein